MTAGRMTFTVDPGLKARIRELVAGGEFPTVSEFVNGAILPKFEIERIAIDGGLPGSGPVHRSMMSRDGRNC